MEFIPSTSQVKIFITRTIIRSILWIFTLLSVSSLAFFLYTSFYIAYIPSASLTKPVYLQFSTDCDSNGQGLCSFPSANVSLTLEQRQERILMRGQPYSINLNLEMPYSPVNQNLGMFMVKADFLTDSGAVIATSSRSCMLHYQSWILRYLSTMVYFFPLVFGWAEEKQTVKILLFDRYMDNTYHPASTINVTIMAKQVEIYSTSITFEACYSGIRYIMHNWPVTSAILAISMNMVIIFFIAAFAYRKNTNIETTSNQEDVASVLPSSTQSESPLSSDLSQESMVSGQHVQEVPDQTTLTTYGRLKVSPLKRRPVRKRCSTQRVSFCSLPRHVHGDRVGLRYRKFPLNRSGDVTRGDSNSCLFPEEDSPLDLFFDEIPLSSSEWANTNRGKLSIDRGTTTDPFEQTTLASKDESSGEFHINGDTRSLREHTGSIVTHSHEDSFSKSRGDIALQGMFSLRETKSESCLSDFKDSDASVDSKHVHRCTLFNLSSLYCAVNDQNQELTSKAHRMFCKACSRYVRRQSVSSDKGFDVLSCTRSVENLDSAGCTAWRYPERKCNNSQVQLDVENTLEKESMIEKDMNGQETNHRNVKNRFSY